MNTRTRLNLVATIAAACAGAAAADPPPIYEFVAADLTRVTGELIDLDAAGATLDTGTGQLLTLPSDDLLGLIAADGHADSASAQGWTKRILVRPGLVTLVDGQRFVGTPSILGAGDDETITWDHPVLGQIEIPLERIDRVQQQRSIIGAAQPPRLDRATTDDVLLLINGDRLEGFLTRAGMEIGFEVDGRELAIGVGSVDQFAVANPPEPLTGAVAWLHDGSAFNTPGLRVRQGLASFSLSSDPDTEAAQARPDSESPGDDRVLLEADSLRAFVLDAERLLPLSSLQPGGTATVTTEPEPFGGAVVRLREPGEAIADLPEHAEWFAATIELPRRARTWGHATMTIKADGREIARFDLTPDDPREAVRLPLHDAETLSFTLESGPFGGVQVTADIRDALVSTAR